jgi:hypothetical protein
MPNERTQQAPAINAEGEHTHGPKAGRDPDNALAPGSMSGSGDVEYTQRIEALLAIPASDRTEAQNDELERAGHPRAGQGEIAATRPPPPRKKPETSTPSGASKDQLGSIRDRNQELLDGAEASADGERTGGSGQTVSSGPSRSGDYSSD